MDRALIEMFQGSRVPRYTSYPTAPHFHSVPDQSANDRLLSSFQLDKPLSLYLHVPFCHQLCWYCGCTTKVVNRTAPIDRYADLLAREIDLLADRLHQPPHLGHIHWGGGTPSIIGGEHFDRLMRRLSERFPIEPDAEIAVELDPRHLNADMIWAMAINGVNRASFGVQSFDPMVQQAINRVQSFADVEACVLALRRAGIVNVSFDLLYGLPHQTSRTCVETIEQAIILQPQRFAVFGFAHLPSRIRHQRLIPQEALPNAAERVAQYVTMRRHLIAAGYEAIGIDHFAVADDELAIARRDGRLKRNFQGYTADPCGQLIGLGLSAISSLPGGYRQNHVAMKDYAAAISRSELPVNRMLAIDHDDRCRREIINTIMCQGEVDLALIAQQFGVAIESIQPEPARFSRLSRCGLVERDGQRLAMAVDRQPFVRLLAACFDRYLDPAANRHAAAL